MTLNDNYFADIWPSRVKIAEEVSNWVLDYYRLAKMSHKIFFFDMLEKLMKEWLRGSHLVIKSTPRVPGDRPLIAIWYKYNSQKALGFISTKGMEVLIQVIPIYPVFLKFNSNVYILPAVCTHILSRYLNACNAIDNHNRIRQYDIAIDIYWVT